MAADLVFVVYGQPAPQGSKRHVGNGVMVESSKKVKPWRLAVTSATVAARGALGSLPVDPSAPFALSVVFTLPRPRSHYRSGRHSDLLRDNAPAYPATMPDLDKLLRSTLDGLADGGAVVNDSRIVTIRAVKVYPGGHLDALDSPGAVIRLTVGG